MVEQPRREVGLWELSLALYPGAILWGFQLWVSYGLVNVSCGHGFKVMFHLVSLVFAAVTAWVSYRGYTLWRGLHEGAFTAAGVSGRAEFMALCGMVANVFFVLLIVVGAVPSFLFDPCVS